MSPQLAEAQQPPAIVERADRFANPSPLQPVKTDFRTEFVSDAVEGQPPAAAIQGSGLSPAVMKLLQERPPRPDVFDPVHPEAFDPGSLVITPGVSEYRGQEFLTHAMIPRGGQVDYVPLNETQINVQKAAIDARLSGRFSTDDVTQLQTLAKAAETLVGRSMHTQALEHQLGKKDFSKPADLNALGGIQMHFAAVAKEPASDSLKLELQTVGEKFGRAYQRGMLCHSHGKSPDDEFARLYTEAVEELGHLREKIGTELLGNIDRVKDISAQSSSRPGPTQPEANAQAAQHIQRLALCFVTQATSDRISGEQLAQQAGKF